MLIMMVVTASITPPQKTLMVEVSEREETGTGDGEEVMLVLVLVVAVGGVGGRYAIAGPGRGRWA